MKKISTKTAVRINAYEIVSRAVDEGVANGLRRAHKHVDAPDQDYIGECVRLAVLNELCEILDFDV